MVTKRLKGQFRSEKGSVPTRPQGQAIAWDIETCPTLEDDLAEVQLAHLEREAKRRSEREPDLTEPEVRSKTASLNPFLGRICSIAAIRGGRRSGFQAPKVYVAESPQDEPKILKAFWEDIQRFPKGVRWVTFNGKRFDAPFLLARSLHHGIAPTRTDLLNDYPYSHRPHADLMWLWPNMNYRLAELCSILGVPSPKSAMDGSKVAKAVQEGRMDEVAAYNADDAMATLACFQQIPTMVVEGTGR